LPLAVVVPIVGSMNRWFRDRALAVALALVLGLGTSLWPARDGAMATMVAAHAERAGAHQCPGCEAGDEAGARPGLCQLVCGAAMVPVAPAPPPPSTAEAVLRHDALPLLGRISSLDPGPPKHHP
jgi:hypothetical protein